MVTPWAPRLRAALAKPFLPIVFFFGGVTWDTITLTRIDRLLDNVLLLLYLCVLGVLIVMHGRAYLKPAEDGRPAGFGRMGRFVARVQPYYPMAIQFLFGSLFSAYTIFYSQSASFTTTAVFFAVLVLLLVGNEFLRDRLSNMALLLALYALVTFSFLTFFLPVVTGWMNTVVFLLGVALTIAVTFRIAHLIYRKAPQRHVEKKWTHGAVLGVISILVIFYFLNWIPPVPLSLKFAGFYHTIAKYDDRYQLQFEKGRWYQVLKRSDDRFHGQGPVYCFTAVFAPVDLKTRIYHRWQYRPSGTTRAARTFMTSDRIPIAISGGREAGYRGYTVKQQVIPGDWRVDVETEDGRVIGRVRFAVEPGEPNGDSVTVVY
ncbi:MAG TPA: DUF2914 domain-containing protein [Nitrospiraceae bacterium]|nr:DUF2914 domain-containing protein [Nitrospiraceae bacterium]